MKSQISLFIFLSLFVSTVYAESEINEIRNLFKGVYKSTYCKNFNFIKCVNISISSCNNAVELNSSKCLSNQLVEAMSGKSKDYEYVMQTIKNESEKYTVCLSEKMLEHLSISENMFNSCGSLITEQLLKEKEKARRDHEKS